MISGRGLPGPGSYPDRGPTRTGQLPPSIVPRKASVTIAERAIAEEAGFDQESEVFAEGVKMQFPRGGDEWMLTEDDNTLSMLSSEAFEANAEVDFFSGEEFFAEAANFTKRRGFTKYEWAGHEGKGAADAIPKADEKIRLGVVAVKFNGAAARHASAGSDLFGNIVEKRRAGMWIGIDEDEPIARGGGCAAVSGAGDLIDGFEDDFGAGGTGDFGGFVGGIVIADDEFGFPAAFVKSG
jgi:hypothetical protein